MASILVTKLEDWIVKNCKFDISPGGKFIHTKINDNKLYLIIKIKQHSGFENNYLILSKDDKHQMTIGAFFKKTMQLYDMFYDNYKIPSPSSILRNFIKSKLLSMGDQFISDDESPDFISGIRETNELQNQLNYDITNPIIFVKPETIIFDSNHNEIKINASNIEKDNELTLLLQPITTIENSKIKIKWVIWQILIGDKVCSDRMVNIPDFELDTKN